MTPPRLHRASSPISPTPQRRLSLSPSRSPKSFQIPRPQRLSRPPSPLLLSPRVTSPPADIARQIAAVTQDLAGLRAEEQRLFQARAQSRIAQPQQRVRYLMIAGHSADIQTLIVDVPTRMFRWAVLPPPLPSPRFSAYYSSRKNASGLQLYFAPPPPFIFFLSSILG